MAPAAPTAAAANPSTSPQTTKAGPNATVSPALAPAPSSTPAPASLSSFARSQSRASSETNGQATFQAPFDGRHYNGQDGRVRDPVPSKLKGKTDNKNGNFSVMQIDLTRPDMTERDAAAKRTSEGTAAAAHQANKDGYRPLKRSKLLFLPLPGEQSTSQSAVAFNGSGQPLGLNPRETKREQARLLTLIRTLHPLLVVDQICKALVFFGGVPDAPPPTDGVFPGSATSNGPGSLFVGWLAEIFPHLENGPLATPEKLPPIGHPAAGGLAANTSFPDLPRATVSTSDDNADSSSSANASANTNVNANATAIVNKNTDAATSSQPGFVKRTRGRPKGSKTKVKKDKDNQKPDGVQHTPSQSTPSSYQQSTAMAHQPNESDFNDAASLAIASVSSQPPGQSQIDPTPGAVSTPGSKKRGRPKGSKNRPKPTPGGQDSAPDPTPTKSTVHNGNALGESPLTHKMTVGQEKPIAASDSGFAIPRQQQQQPSPNMGLSEAPTHPMLLVQNSTTMVPRAAATSSPYQAPLAPQHSQQPSHASSNTAPARKRKAPRQLQDGQQETMGAPMPDMGGGSMESIDSAIPKAVSVQALQPKRRRISKETGRQPSFSGMDSLSTRPDISASSTMNPGVSDSSLQPSPVSSAFNSPVQNNRISNFRSNSNQMAQQQQPQPSQLQLQQAQHIQGQAQYQRQAQNLQLQQKQHSLTQQYQQAQQQHSPSMGSQRPSLAATSSRQRSQMAGQQPGNRTQQSFQQQQQQQQHRQQMMTQFGSGGNANFARTVGNNSPAQYQHSNIVNAGVTQGSFSQPPPPTASSSSSLDNRNTHQSPNFNPPQPPPSSQQQQTASTLGPFPGYTADHHASYMGMGYGGSTGAAGTSVTFSESTGTHLDDTLGEPEMRQRFYSSINRP